MAMIGRKQPAVPATPDGSKPARRAVAGGSGGGSGRPPAAGAADTTRTGRLRGNIRDIMAELRKVTWPTRGETRNLTIVVIGISASVGLLLAALDFILSYLYNLIG
jgi:preprotein translocase subunit SecE